LCRSHIALDIHDYIANLSVRFEEARCFLYLFKRERARDDWFQLARRESVCDESFCTLESSFVVRDLSIADNVKLLLSTVNCCESLIVFMPLPRTDRHTSKQTRSVPVRTWCRDLVSSRDHIAGENYRVTVGREYDADPGMTVSDDPEAGVQPSAGG